VLNEFDAFSSGHHKIGDEQVKVQGARDAHSFLSFAGLHHFITGFFKNLLSIGPFSGVIRTKPKLTTNS
jgi:hypothetical protein